MRDLAPKRRQAQPNHRRGEEKPTVVSIPTTQYKVDSAESQSFQLVDTAKSSLKALGGQTFKRKTFQPKRNLQVRRTGGIALVDATPNHRNQPQRNRFSKQKNANWIGTQKGGGKRYDSRWGRADRQASVKVGDDWTLLEEFDLNQFTKLKANIPEAEDLLWCGFLDQYNDAYDKVNTKSERPLRKMDNKEFYMVGTTDDPVIEKFAIEGAGNVYATDAIISHLMASPRSVYPWDLIAQKLPDGTIFFDKRDSSQFDFLTVSETANDPPLSDEAKGPDDVNAPERLSLEATMINQNFSQQILRPPAPTTRKTFDNPNPFFSEEDADGMEPASVGFRYRRFNMGEGISLVCRCELHGVVPKKSVTGAVTEELMTAYALNEWDGRESGGIDWRPKLDAQRGAVLATELKNNSCKLARWAAQSIIAGAEHMKIGYVSRTVRTSNHEHVVLATQSFDPIGFATQINMSPHNMWGIIKMLIELLQKQGEGKYVLLRDPNKAVVRLYGVPVDFDEEDEEDEEDGEVEMGLMNLGGDNE